MEERLRRLLCDRVEAVLRTVEYVARAEGDGTTVPPSVLRAWLTALTTGWRVLLAEHSAGALGRCRHCDRPRLVRREPCSAWRVAYAYLVARVPPNAS